MASRAGRVAAALGVMAAVCLGGCGKGKTPITGKVTLDDRPVRSGEVTFVAADKTKHTTIVGFDGRYTIEVPPGEYKVSVQPASPPGPKKMMAGMPKFAPPKAPKGLPAMKSPSGDVGGESVDLAKESQNPLVIPVHYRNPDSSGLKLTVTGSEDTFNITMKTKG